MEIALAGAAAGFSVLAGFVVVASIPQGPSAEYDIDTGHERNVHGVMPHVATNLAMVAVSFVWLGLTIFGMAPTWIAYVWVGALGTYILVCIYRGS